jgi:hypothetical protein
LAFGAPESKVWECLGDDWEEKLSELPNILDEVTTEEDEE